MVLYDDCMPVDAGPNRPFILTYEQDLEVLEPLDLGLWLTPNLESAVHYWHKTMGPDRLMVLTRIPTPSPQCMLEVTVWLSQQDHINRNNKDIILSSLNRTFCFLGILSMKIPNEHLSCCRRAFWLQPWPLPGIWICLCGSLQTLLVLAPFSKCYNSYRVSELLLVQPLPWDHFALGDPTRSYCSRHHSSQGYWSTQTPPPPMLRW